MKALNFFIMSIFALMLGYFLPSFIDLALPLDQNVTRVKFSTLTNEFMIQKTNKLSGENKFYLENGKEISEDTFMQNQPFSYYGALIKNNKFPKELEIYEKNTTLIMKNSQSISAKYISNLFKPVKIFPFMYDDEKYAKPAFAQFLIAFNANLVEVIDPAKNVPNLELTDELNLKLKEQKFTFPAMKFFTNPTPLKAFDEGAFLLDSKDEIYHLKFDGKNFSIKDTNIAVKDVLNIVVSENQRREFYALVVAKDSIGLIGYDYKFISLPSTPFDYKKTNVSLAINPLHKILTLTSKDQISTYVMDQDYKLIAQNHTKLEPPLSKRYLKQFVLPFELKITQENYFFNFKFSDFSIKALALSLFLAFITFVFVKKKDPLCAIFVAVFGIYGFIATLIFSKDKL